MAGQVEDDELVAVPLAEERATIAKREVATGRVTVRTTTAIREETVHEELAEETVEVRRVPIDRIVETLPDLRTEGDVTIIPVLEERVVVTKQLVLVEEVHITRRRSIETVDVPVTLRRQSAEVEEREV